MSGVTPEKRFLLFLLFSHYVEVFHIFSCIYIPIIYRCSRSKPPDHNHFLCCNGHTLWLKNQKSPNLALISLTLILIHSLGFSVDLKGQPSIKLFAKNCWCIKCSLMLECVRSKKPVIVKDTLIFVFTQFLCFR